MPTGIICEYNPFHNGHIYHLKEVRKIIKDDILVLVLSGNYTERGNVSIIEKYDKASLALEYGVDLVIELPFEFASQASDIFAKGSISILNKLKCDKLIFGSESNDTTLLEKLADIQLNNKEYDKLVKKELDKGINYPTALSNALKEITNDTVTEPNDLLGLSYAKEIKRNNYNIKLITIKRTNDYNEIELNKDISSARSIREALKNGKDISKTIPNETKDLIINYDENKLFNLIKYKIISDKDLSIYQTVDEGIDNKLKKEIDNVDNIDDLVKSIKSKRYTYNKITRMLTHILCSYTKEDNKLHQDIKYIKVLGFNNKGKEYLNKIKKDIDVPIITNINKDNIDLLELELKVDEIYNLITNRKDNLYKKKPIIKDNTN
jgi:predicted nucleotidyltransferase